MDFARPHLKAATAKSGDAPETFLDLFALKQHLTIESLSYAIDKNQRKNSRMMHFEHTSFIAAPVERVFAFHERPDAIQLLMPPWQKVDLLQKIGGLEVGSLVVFRVWFGPFPVRWIAHHIAYQKNRLFTDEQREGPFRAWVHSHVMEPEEGGTRLIDSIDFEPPLGSFTERFFPWLVERELRKLFTFRHQTTRRYCETSP